MATIETEPAKQTRNQSTALRDWVRALEATAPIAANPRRLLPGIVEELAQTRGDAPALLSVSENLTYGALTKRANAYARWALDQRVAVGETVCLMMPNRPEYMAIWLGLTSVGVVVSLINTQLRGLALSHCINIVAPKHVIVAAELCDELTSDSGAAGEPAENLDARGRGQRRIRPHRPLGRAILGSTSDAVGASRRDDRRSSSTDLYLWLDRSAKGRQRQSSAIAAMESLVRRFDEYRARGSHV